MTRRETGGRKEAHPDDVRQRAMERAAVVGAERAGAEVGVAAGTVRSWVRRAKLKAEKDRIDLSGLEQVRREGAAIIARRELQMVSPEGARLSAAQERVRLATIRWLETSDGSRDHVEAEIELTEAKIHVAELREALESREW
jgi:hypothetical protein